jgi:hypothetical protein
LYAERIFAAWKTGRSPGGGDLDTIWIDELLDLTFLIRRWEELARHQGYKFLAALLGGDGKSAKKGR